MSETLDKKVDFWVDSSVATGTKVIENVTLGIAGYVVGLALGTISDDERLATIGVIPYTLGLAAAQGRFVERLACGLSGGIGYQAGLATANVLKNL